MSTEISALEADAKAKAIKHVANMLHAPDKLEKLQQMMFNVERKKASVEAMLKTAMQSQLDGVKTGLTQLEKAMVDIREVHNAMSEMDESLVEVPALVDLLKDLRKETVKHTQLATARENLKHIFMVPETVRQTEALITEGRLLEAHRSLTELENSRDDLMYELHKLPALSPSDKAILRDYFEPVMKLSISLEKQIKFTLRRTLNTVRKDPKVIVSALRVVEREEKADAEFAALKKSTGFCPPDRPKNWKTSCLDVLRKNVEERIEGNQLDTRDDNRMWLVRHLELIRIITLEDLRIAKTLCKPVFPDHYEILDFFINTYHEVVSIRLEDIIAGGLEGQEYVTFLSWIIQTYPGKELMADPMLGISPDKVKPLLDKSVLDELQQKYLNNIQENYNQWMKRTLDQEVEDWKKEEDPELDNDGCFHTSAPIIVYQMIDENLQVAETISSDLVMKVLASSMKEVDAYGQMLRNAISAYKTNYFKDRRAISRFTRYMIAIVNNCERFEQLSQELKNRWWKPGHHDKTGTELFERLLKTFAELKTESSGFLLDESFLDIDAHFNDILTSSWANSTDAIDTVCATLEDYFEDYQYLKERNFESVITMAQDRVARRYITSMLQNSVLRRKITFETPTDRRNAATKITEESKQLKRFFKRVAGDMADFDSPFDALTLLAEVLYTDEEMLHLDLGKLKKRYSDLNHDQLLCLLTLRGDLNKAEAKELATDYAPPEDEGSNRIASTLQAKSIFSQVKVTSKMIDAAGAATAVAGAGQAAAKAIMNANAAANFMSSNPFAQKQQAPERPTTPKGTNPFGDEF